MCQHKSIYATVLTFLECLWKRKDLLNENQALLASVIEGQLTGAFCQNVLRGIFLVRFHACEHLYTKVHFN